MNIFIFIFGPKNDIRHGLTGVKFAKTESRSETFANDATSILQRTENNLRNAKRNLTSTQSVGLLVTLTIQISSPSGETPITKTPCAMTWALFGTTASPYWTSLAQELIGKSW